MSVPHHARELAHLRDLALDLEIERTDVENQLVDLLADLARNRRQTEQILTKIITTLDAMLGELTS